MKKLLCVLLIMMMPLAYAKSSATVQLKAGHPKYYTVKPKDTLWSIASVFLVEPWQWAKIWQVTDVNGNFEQLFPGDVLELKTIDGQPKLVLAKGGTIKLSPHIRSEPLSTAIPAIPIETIRPYLNQSLVVSADELNNTPYVIAQSGEHLATGAGDKVVVQGINPNSDSISYKIYRLGQAYIEPGSKENLGFAATYVGNARLLTAGSPSVMLLTKTSREVLVGDRLLPSDDSQAFGSIYPHEPKNKIAGKILAVQDGLTQIGQFQTVVIDKGKTSKVDVGDVLAINRGGRVIKDTIAIKAGKEDATVTMPNERVGLLLIYRTFEKVSFGLVVKATGAIHVLDSVDNP